jgi:hypothetical protein
MANQPKHIQWLIDTKQRLKTADGKLIRIWEFCHQPDDQILSDWAKHFRNHYCPDDRIDQLRHGTGLSRKGFLISVKFPDAIDAPGPSIRAGDFGEILVADYLEYTRGFWVPRPRYNNKNVRNESIKGCDIIGIHFVRDGVVSLKDTLAVFEVKAQLTGRRAECRLQTAVDDSTKDLTRKAETLSAMKQRFLELQDAKAASRVERFQDPLDRPYREVSGAIAIFSEHLFDPPTIRSTTAIQHPNRANLELIVFRGPDLMDLVHELYRRAADEA